MGLDDLREWDVPVAKVSGRWDKSSLRVLPFGDAPGRFEAGGKLCLVVGEERRLLHISAARRQGKFLVLDCGLSEAEADVLTGKELTVHPTMRAPLPPDEFYLDELFGMRAQTEAGEDLGEITEILESKAHDVYVTTHAMIPAVPDFVVRIDWEQRVLIVRDVPGLRSDGSASSGDNA